jgi:hypothetical protein
MAKKDNLLKAFLADPFLKEKYEVDAESINSLADAEKSDVPIVRVIAKMVKSGQDDQQTYTEIINYLNSEL